MQLRRRSITDIILCGISTSIGVESTARALGVIFPRLGEFGTTAEIVEKLP